MTNYQHAQHLYQLGFSLIPIRHDTKIPALAWKRYQSERCTEADLDLWFNRCGFAIGIVTGEVSGIVAVDCDDADAVDAMIDNSCCDGGLEESLVFQRTKRGMHLIYRDGGVNTRNTVRCLGAKIDVRANGGYIRAYPDSQNWTAAELAMVPVYQPLPRESLVPA